MGDSRERRRGFVIPVGAQVVLREDLQLAGGVVRKQGLVAVVVQSPPHTAEPYTVQFADGRTATVLERQSALRAL